VCALLPRCNAICNTPSPCPSFPLPIPMHHRSAISLCYSRPHERPVSRNGHGPPSKPSPGTCPAEHRDFSRPDVDFLLGHDRGAEVEERWNNTRRIFDYCGWDSVQCKCTYAFILTGEQATTAFPCSFPLLVCVNCTAIQQNCLGRPFSRPLRIVMGCDLTT
jgi:hypothetical protein